MKDSDKAAPGDPATHSTEVILRRWREGDREAVGALSTRLAVLLAMRIRAHKLWPILSRNFSAEDLAQEVWARVLEAGPQAFQSQGKGSFMAWLARLSDHTLTDLIRFQQARKRGGDQAGQRPLDTRSEQDAQVLPGVSPPASPSQNARADEIARVAHEVLSERERIVWFWIALDGYTPQEVAFALSTTSSSVRGLLLRSRKKLQEAMDAIEGNGAS